MSLLHDGIFENCLIPIKKTKLDSTVIRGCYNNLKERNDRIIEYFCSTTRKFGLSDMALQELFSCKIIGEAEKAEYSFYTGIFLLSATLDSLACLLNELYGLSLSAKQLYFNKDFIDKLPNEIKKGIEADWKILGEKKFREYRNAIEHRIVFPTIPVRGSEPKLEQDEVEGFVVLKNPDESIFEEAVFNKFSQNTTDVYGLLAIFSKSVENILRQIFNTIK